MQCNETILPTRIPRKYGYDEVRSISRRLQPDIQATKGEGTESTNAGTKSAGANSARPEPAGANPASESAGANPATSPRRKSTSSQTSPRRKPHLAQTSPRRNLTASQTLTLSQPKKPTTPLDYRNRAQNGRSSFWRQFSRAYY